ncbi:hypothetical protein HMPREF9130_0690 [Peptoniphilus sp. oral taxon 375 str. F0436]|nr:hypothetical protein HMPREF9130_0690 [Peptoniphilus sp. oral taxon 375 str. F0436]
MQTTSEIQQGQVVRSLAGRDKDRYFLVLEVVDKTYVLLVDGKLRKLAKPKKRRSNMCKS